LLTRIGKSSKTADVDLRGFLGQTREGLHDLIYSKADEAEPSSAVLLKNKKDLEAHYYNTFGKNETVQDIIKSGRSGIYKYSPASLTDAVFSGDNSIVKLNQLEKGLRYGGLEEGAISDAQKAEGENLWNGLRAHKLNNMIEDAKERYTTSDGTQGQRLDFARLNKSWNTMNDATKTKLMGNNNVSAAFGALLDTLERGQKYLSDVSASDIANKADIFEHIAQKGISKGSFIRHFVDFFRNYKDLKWVKQNLKAAKGDIPIPVKGKVTTPLKTLLGRMATTVPGTLIGMQ
jgi:hypothetical protein